MIFCFSVSRYGTVPYMSGDDTANSWIFPLCTLFEVYLVAYRYLCESVWTNCAVVSLAKKWSSLKRFCRYSGPESVISVFFFTKGGFRIQHAWGNACFDYSAIKISQIYITILIFSLMLNDFPHIYSLESYEFTKQGAPLKKEKVRVSSYTDLFHVSVDEI